MQTTLPTTRALPHGHKVYNQTAQLVLQALVTLGVMVLVAWQGRKPDKLWAVRHVVAVVVLIPAFVLWLAARWQLAHAGAFAVGPAAPPKLVTTGCYYLFSHPVYVFSLVWSAAFCVLTDHLYGTLVVFFILAPIQMARARSEDKILERRFLGIWGDWRKRVLLM